MWYVILFLDSNVAVTVVLCFSSFPPPRYPLHTQPPELPTANHSTAVTNRHHQPQPTAATKPQQDTYFTMLTQFKMLEQQTTIHAAAVEAADKGQLTLLGGRLAATLAAAVKSVFVPDVADQHVEQARTVLVSWFGSWSWLAATKDKRVWRLTHKSAHIHTHNCTALNKHNKPLSLSLCTHTHIHPPTTNAGAPGCADRCPHSPRQQRGS